MAGGEGSGPALGLGKVASSSSAVTVVGGRGYSTPTAEAGGPVPRFSQTPLLSFCVVLPLSCRAVTDSINQLITMCTQQAPGQKECDNALRELEVSWPVKQRGGMVGGRACPALN